MVDLARKATEVTSKLKELCMIECVKQGALDDLPVEGIQALQLCNELVDLNNKLLIKNAEMMVQMSNKLNNLELELKSKN
jgi:hypothetical protein